MKRKKICMKLYYCLPMKCLGTSRHSFGNVNVSQIKLELEVLVFEESKKLEYLEKNLLKQRQKQTTNSTLMSSMPRLEPGHTLMGGNCAPLASWVPSLNINTLIPYTVHYHFFLILVVLFSLFLLTLMNCMFDPARIIEEEMKCQRLLLQYITHLV